MIIFLVFSFFLSWLSLIFLVPYLRQRLVDHPNPRSSHCVSTPRGGGVVFVAIPSTISLFYLLNGYFSFYIFLPLVLIPLALVGLFDDRFDLPALVRFVVHFLTAAVLIIITLRTVLTELASVNFLFAFFVFLFLSFVVTSSINFTNFMDGIDGLVAGSMSVALPFLLYSLSVPPFLWSLVGALLGFLAWNWNPARVFMGDVGSTFLGGFFAVLVLQANSLQQAVGMLLVATPLFGDAFICILRRAVAGHSIFAAHKLHLFQRLHQSGWSHSKVSLVYIVATFILSVAYVTFGLNLVLIFSFCVFVFGFWLDRNVAVPFSIASRL